MKYIRRILNWFTSVFVAKRYELIRCEDVPDIVDSDSIYIIGEGEHEWHLVMGCPCGCGSIIYLNLLPDTRPRWSYGVRNGQISVHPSVWRTTGCCSHFWIREGRLEWAKNITVNRN